MTSELLLTSTYAQGPSGSFTCNLDANRNSLLRLSKDGHDVELLQRSNDNASPRGFGSWNPEADESPSSSPTGSKWTDVWRIGPFRKLTRDELEARVELEKVRREFGKKVDDLRELRLAVKREYWLLAGVRPGLKGQDLTRCPPEADKSEQATLLRRRKDAWLKLAAYIVQWERLMSLSSSMTCLYVQVHGHHWICPEYYRLVQEGPSLDMNTYCEDLYFVPDIPQCYEVFKGLPKYVQDFEPRFAHRRLKMKGK